MLFCGHVVRFHSTVLLAWFILFCSYEVIIYILIKFDAKDLRNYGKDSSIEDGIKG